MKLRFSFIALFFCSLIALQLNLKAAVTLSEKSQVSLITCGPGKDLYEAFGHTAIRVYDPENRLNIVYNYGIFSFSQENFYANFAKGHLWYQLGANDFDRFVYSYEYNERSVYEQILNFNLSQRQVLYDSLVNNIKPQNRYYLYDYFYHNCSTIPRDVIEYASGYSIEYKYTDFVAGKSIRDLVDEYLHVNSWGDFGIDLALGAVIDGEATFHEYLYLPEYLMEAFSTAQLQTIDGTIPLVKKTITHYESDVDYYSERIWPGPLETFGLFFALLLLITIWNFRTHRAFKGLDFLLFLVLGIHGTILFLISFFTDHNAAAQNYNLLWSLPTHLIFAFLIFMKNKGLWFSVYLWLTIAFCTLILTDDLILPQNFHPATTFILLAIILRSGWLLYYRKIATS